jgi:aminoacrylate hydrolase
VPHARGLHYELHGDPGAPPLLLSSGLGGLGGYWAPNLPHLSERHNVIVYDHRGTGRSDRTLPDASVSAMAADIIGLVDDLELGPVALIGHAAGGVAGLEAALAAPERFRCLVVVNGWLSADRHFLRCFETRLALLRGSGVEAYVRAQPPFLYPANWISAHFDALEQEAAHQLAAFPGRETVERRIAGLAAFDISGAIAGLAVPTLALAADDDMLVPSRCSDAFAELPSVEVARMPWGGHACNVTDPEGFAAIVLPFLARGAFRTE